MEGLARAWDHVRALTDGGGSYEMVIIYKPLPAVSGKGQKSKGEPEADVPDPADDMDWELVALDEARRARRDITKRMAREGRRARRARTGQEQREVEEDKNTPM